MPISNRAGAMVQASSKAVLPWICLGASSSERARNRITQNTTSPKTRQNTATAIQKTGMNRLLSCWA